LEPVFDALAQQVKSSQSIQVGETTYKVQLNNKKMSKIIALGRKNHLFSGSIEGAGRVAAFYSLIETAKLHKVEPWEYISYLFQNLDDNGKCKAILPCEFEKIITEIDS
jgi:transposase